MIDVLKRLAELDANNPNIIKESSAVQECGPMGMMAGSHTPASINMTADSGSELTGMLRDIMQLAGLHQVGAQDLGVEHEPMSLTAEPVKAVGAMVAEPLSGADDMRSVLDKMNPEPSDGDELGAFQHDSDAGEEDEEETDESWNNTPEDPNTPPPVDADEYAHHENQPGSGETSNGEKRQSNMPTATYEGLMAEYKKFIGESKEEEKMDETKEEMDEGTCPSCHKDPCQCESTEESVDEGNDILKLAGLK